MRWVKLTIQDRIDAVRTGKVDLECSTTTWTLSRQQLVDFSLVTFVDGGSLLVKSDADARPAGGLRRQAHRGDQRHHHRARAARGARRAAR